MLHIIQYFQFKSDDTSGSIDVEDYLRYWNVYEHIFILRLLTDLFIYVRFVQRRLDLRDVLLDLLAHAVESYPPRHITEQARNDNI